MCNMYMFRELNVNQWSSLVNHNFKTARSIYIYLILPCVCILAYMANDEYKYGNEHHISKTASIFHCNLKHTCDIFQYTM
ncbi:hypothetical protein Patl1_35754 [Pistacia atlantica]|nr:hypothetical protein Patl1_35754 [Pistacia atlantica]